MMSICCLKLQQSDKNSKERLHLWPEKIFQGCTCMQRGLRTYVEKDVISVYVKHIIVSLLQLDNVYQESSGAVEIPKNPQGQCYVL